MTLVLGLLANNKPIGRPPNIPFAIMAADVKNQTSVLRKNSLDYPQCGELETATNASAKTLPAIAPRLQVTGARFHRESGASVVRKFKR